MAMVGVDSGSLYRRTHSLSRLAWSWVGGRLTPFYIHQINRVNSRNGSAMMTAPQTLSWILLLLSILQSHRCKITRHKKLDRAQKVQTSAKAKILMKSDPGFKSRFLDQSEF